LLAGTGRGQATLFLSGVWHLPRIAEIDAALAGAGMPASPLTLDGAALATLDTAAALALLGFFIALGSLEKDAIRGRDSG
jgi:hypothetical protein